MERLPIAAPRMPLMIAYIGFIALGMTFGLLGLAWPSMRAEFGLPLDAVAPALLGTTVAYLITSFICGPLVFRLGYGRLFTFGGALMGIAILGIAVSPSWIGVLLAAPILGFGQGMVDAGLNSYVAANHGARAMNWLHAAFGIGVTFSPLILNAALNSSAAWREGYSEGFASVVILNPFILDVMLNRIGAWRIGYAAVFGVTIVIFFLYAFVWQQGVRGWRAPAALEAGKSRVTALQTLRLPAMWIAIVMFFSYAGLEATPGQWSYSLFIEGRGVAPETAGNLISLFWASFTLGRIFFGSIITRFKDTAPLIRVCLAGSIVAAGLFWWSPVEWIGFAGLIALGFAQAPLFPVLVSRTGLYLGDAHVPNAIGFQAAGAGMGFAILPALTGILAQRIGLEVIGPIIFFSGIAMLGLYFTLEGRTRRA